MAKPKLHIFGQKSHVQVLPDHQPVTLTQVSETVGCQAKADKVCKQIRDFCGSNKWKLLDIPGII